MLASANAALRAQVESQQLLPPQQQLTAEDGATEVDAAAQHANRNMRARKAKEEQTKHLQRMFGRESGQSGARNDPLGSLTQSSLQPRSLTSEELREMSMENPEMAARELLWRRLTEMA